MSDIVLTPAERALLEALHELDVRFLIVGLGAAVLEGAPVATQDLDVWFGRIDTTRLEEAARRAGGFSRIYDDPTPLPAALAVVEQMATHPRCRLAASAATHLEDVSPPER